jgi:hypothetical protein
MPENAGTKLLGNGVDPGEQRNAQKQTCTDNGANSLEVLAGVDLSQGFLVPVDEIADLEPFSGFVGIREGTEGTVGQILFTLAPQAEDRSVWFVEVKHRRHLRTARQPELLEGILKQTGDLSCRWNSYLLIEYVIAFYMRGFGVVQAGTCANTAYMRQ